MKRSTAGSLALCGALMSMALWSEVATARDCPAELPVNTGIRSVPLPDNKLYTINVGAETRQVLLYWDDLPGTIVSTDEPPELANRFIARLESYLQAMLTRGFRIPPGAAHPCVSGKALRVFLYQAPPGASSGGYASGNRFDVIFSQASAERQTVLADTMPSLLHEMFHLVQRQYRLGAQSRKWLTEGTATLASDVFDSYLDNSGSPGDDSCRKQVLADPFKTMFARNSQFGDGTNSCQPVVFWRYFTEQLGNDRAEPGAGVRVIHDLFEFLESNRGRPAWKTAATDHIHGAGDFDGDGREELLITSSTHLGLIASTEADSRVVAVKAFGYPIGGNWTLKASDQILGIGDFNFDGKDEFLIRNAGFIALIGASSEGRLQAVAGVPLGTGVFADWRPTYRDQLIAIGDFDGNGADEAMFRGRSRIGLLRLDQSGQFTSPFSTSLSRLVRRLNRNPGAINVVGVGDIDGNSRDEIVARDKQGLFVWGLDAEGRHASLFSVDYGERIGADWRLRREDIFMGVRDLDGTVNDAEDLPGLRAEIIVANNFGVGVIGMNSLSRQLESKAGIGIGDSIGDERVFGTGTRIQSIGRFIGPVGNQIMLRDGNALALVQYDHESAAGATLRPVASLTLAPGKLAPMPEQRQQRLNRGSLEGRFNVVDQLFISEITGAATASLAGRESEHLMLRGRDRLLTFKAVIAQTSGELADGRVILEHEARDGQYQRSLVSAVDEFIKQKDPTRSLDSMWHDLSMMLLVKNSVGSSMGERFFLRDEVPPGVVVDVDGDNQTPPAALMFDPIEVSTTFAPDSQPDYLTSPFMGRPYSAQYFFVKPVDYARVVDVRYRNLTADQWFDLPVYRRPLPQRSSVSVVIVAEDKAPLVKRDINQGDGDMDQRYRLAPGQWMGVVISTAGQVHPQSLGVRVGRASAAH